MSTVTSPPNRPNGLIHNIKQDSQQIDLRKEIVDGLKAEPPMIPSLVLWDDEGLKCYNTLAQTNIYYILHKDMEVLNLHANEIVASIPDESIIIELGCGSLNKTGVILSQFEQQQREISYFALDISGRELARNLTQLAAKFEGSAYIKIQGLLGSYDDGIDWLGGLARTKAPKSVLFLWIGNSIANLLPAEASSFLKKCTQVCEDTGIAGQFIISADKTKDDARILEAYDTSDGPHRDFVLNGLRSTNSIFGKEIFSLPDWACYTELTADRTIRLYYRALKDLTINLDGEVINVREGQRIFAIRSGKWDETAIRRTCASAGLKVIEDWHDPDNNYGYYSIKPLSAIAN